MSKSPGLSAAEDQELRQLIWFCRVGDLSDTASARLLELIRRDRRLKVRDARPDPSTVAAGNPAAAGPRFDRDRLDTVTCPNCGSSVAVPRD